MSILVNKREIKSIKINSKVEILKVLSENNQNLGYMTYLSAGKIEPENRFDSSFINLKDTFIKSDIHNLTNMRKIINLVLNVKNSQSEIEIFSLMSIFSFVILFTSDIFTLFALPNSWDDSLSFAFSGHIQQIGLPSDIFSANKYSNYLSIFAFFSAVIRLIVVHGSVWLARPLHTIKKFLTENIDKVYSDLCFQISIFIITFKSIFLF